MADSNGLHFDPITKTLQGTPLKAGKFTLTLNVTDSAGEQAQTNFVLTVNPSHAPTAKLTTPIYLNPQSKQVIDIRSYFNDPDGDKLTYALTQPIDGIGIDTQTGKLSIQAQQLNHNAPQTISITATDPYGDSVELSQTLIVAKPSALSTIDNPYHPIHHTLHKPLYSASLNHSPYHAAYKDGKAWMQGTGFDDIIKAQLYKASILEGKAGNDTLIGAQYDDTLKGGYGNDILKGNQGNDILMGGQGNDVYLYQKNDGLDTIFDTQGKDTLYLQNISMNDLLFDKQGDDPLIHFKTDTHSTHQTNPNHNAILINNYQHFDEIRTNEGVFGLGAVIG